ncbi:hypothetical protein [Brotaphodocola sp.]|uniref:hypothetical protein n=1 Tax=Brotaphodocola sp. TaxID=3073577 RepID=UPI003D7E3D87
MKKTNSLGIMMAALMAVSMTVVTGCSNHPANDETMTVQTIAHDDSKVTSYKPAINFEGKVSSVDGQVITLEDGKKILITEDTGFGGDPDTNNEVSREILPGNFIQGYTDDQPEQDEVTAVQIWTNTPETEK